MSKKPAPSFHNSWLFSLSLSLPPPACNEVCLAQLCTIVCVLFQHKSHYSVPTEHTFRTGDPHWDGWIDPVNRTTTCWVLERNIHDKSTTESLFLLSVIDCVDPRGVLRFWYRIVPIRACSVILYQGIAWAANLQCWKRFLRPPLPAEPSTSPLVPLASRALFAASPATAAPSPLVVLIN